MEGDKEDDRIRILDPIGIQETGIFQQECLVDTSHGGKMRDTSTPVYQSVGGGYQEDVPDSWVASTNSQVEHGLTIISDL